MRQDLGCSLLHSDGDMHNMEECPGKRGRGFFLTVFFDSETSSAAVISAGCLAGGEGCDNLSHLFE